MTLPSASDPPAILVEDVSVRYRTILEPLAPWRLVLPGQRARNRVTVDALCGVSLSVPWGTVLGVIGRNGAGKTTLLRTMAGILAPSVGRVTMRGRVAPLLSLGVGFNTHLSGRENILLGGLAAGMTADEIRAATPSIVEFAELGRFIDHPVRTYSSGMGKRLAFAVATHLSPDVLLVDEMLGAGDIAFREKAAGKMHELYQSGRIIVLVSHGLTTIRELCSSCVWLHEGKLVLQGDCDEVIERYMRFCRVRRSTAIVEEEDEGAARRPPAAGRADGRACPTGPPPSTITWAIRSPAWPSQRAGRRAGAGSKSACRAASRIRARSLPTTWFVPSLTVIGRSVVSRRVRHGIPRTVVSSWMPPESVSTRRAWACSARKSR